MQIPVTRALSALALSICVAGTVYSADSIDPVDPAIQGFWFGTDTNGVPVNRVRRSVLLIRGDEFTILDPRGITTSTARYSPTADPPEIDIDRYDGETQRGVYSVDRGALLLTLGNPGLQRPTGRTVEKAGGVDHSHYRFRRTPTMEGLEVLQRLLQDEGTVTFIGEPYVPSESGADSVVR